MRIIRFYLLYDVMWSMGKSLPEYRIQLSTPGQDVEDEIRRSRESCRNNI